MISIYRESLHMEAYSGSLHRAANLRRKQTLSIYIGSGSEARSPDGEPLPAVRHSQLCATPSCAPPPAVRHSPAGSPSRAVRHSASAPILGGASFLAACPSTVSPRSCYLVATRLYIDAVEWDAWKSSRLRQGAGRHAPRRPQPPSPGHQRRVSMRVTRLSDCSTVAWFTNHSGAPTSFSMWTSISSARLRRILSARRWR